MKNTLFKREWEGLEKYYKKSHTRDEKNLYYLKLKDLDDDEFLEIIDLIYKNCKFFPNIAEIRELPKLNRRKPKWLGIKIEKEEINEKERKELEDLLKDFKEKKEIKIEKVNGERTEEEKIKSFDNILKEFKVGINGRSEENGMDTR